MSSSGLSACYTSVCLLAGAYPGFGRGGARIIFVKFGNLHGEAMRFAKGLRGHAPRAFFGK